ncbi:hypothetical protein FB45DRAFT_869465 [Roridomyces roridus]|uniref:Uncharacterized protein n=1 Tax=Roridomyces roridus TaxID=1738132 RepID=A0AAD7BLC3_9AGAR|nr:hypothetical protein FB45DRAFT_869465 [Roridomyces roridus]
MQCPTLTPITTPTLSVSDAHVLMLRGAFSPCSRPLSIAHPGLARRPSLTVTPTITDYAHLKHQIGVENIIVRTSNEHAEHVPACDSEGGMGRAETEVNIRQMFRRRSPQQVDNSRGTRLPVGVIAQLGEQQTEVIPRSSVHLEVPCSIHGDAILFTVRPFDRPWVGHFLREFAHGIHREDPAWVALPPERHGVCIKKSVQCRMYLFLSLGTLLQTACTPREAVVVVRWNVQVVGIDEDRAKTGGGTGVRENPFSPRAKT